MVFERLPPETLIDIVEYARLDGTISSLRNLASVSQSLNHIVTPMLYLNFTEASRKSVPKFLRTILAKPQLATYIQHYTGYGISNEPSPEKLHVVAMLRQSMQMAEAGRLSQEGEVLDVSDLKDSDFEACRRTLKKIKLNREKIDDWMSRIREGKWHALTSLVLLLLPNLEDIEMIDYRYDEVGDMDYALGISARLQSSGSASQFSLEHLNDVSLSALTPEDYEPGRNPDPEYLHFADIIPFLALPSVQSVAISRLASEGGRYYGADSVPTGLEFQTKDLEINDSCLEMWSLASFLRLFTSLRRLSYNHVAVEQAPDFLPQKIGKAIAHLHPCLEELEISSMCEQNGKYTTPREIGSLARFEQLESIDVEGCILFGYPDPEDESMPVLRLCDILPRSLKSLVVSLSDSPCHEEHLRELLWVKEEMFPELKKVKIKGLGRTLNNAKGLKNEFKAKGVKLLL